MSAIPTGSFAPDSPSRIVPERPPTWRLPRTENITAGSVGAIAAPIRPAVVHEKPSTECPNRAISPVVANVPSTPSEAIGQIEPRSRRQPTCIPPSKRITISAITPSRSTVRIGSAVRRRGNSSEATAAPIRKSAGPGIGNRSVALFARSAR